jgi:hypothetical protein
MESVSAQAESYFAFGTAWGQWNPLWPVAAVGCAAITAYANCECPKLNLTMKTSILLSLPHMLLHGTQPAPALPLPLGSTVKVLRTLIVPLIYLISTEIYGTTEATLIETDYRTPTHYTPKTLSASTPLVTYTGVPTDIAPTDTYLQLTQSANVTPTSTNYPESSNLIYSSAESITFLTSALLPAALSFL